MVLVALGPLEGWPWIHGENVLPGSVSLQPCLAEQVWQHWARAGLNQAEVWPKRGRRREGAGRGEVTAVVHERRA